MIEIKGISKKYENKNKKAKLALNNINIKFPDTGMVFITGKSGSGKTTLINMLSGMDLPTSGEIIYNGENILNHDYDLDIYRRRDISFVFQDFNLIEAFSVRQNLVLSLGLKDYKEEESLIKDILDSLNLSDSIDKFPNELSGGEQQRIAISRALIRKTSVMLADEPTGNLDSKSSEELYNILKPLSLKMLVIIVTHDCVLANKHADMLLEIQDGKILKTTYKNDKLKYTQRPDQFDNKENINKVSFVTLYRIAKRNFKKTRIKSMFAISLMTISLILVGLFVTISNYDLNQASIDTFDNVDAEIVPFGICSEKVESSYTCTKSDMSREYLLDMNARDEIDLDIFSYDYEMVTSNSFTRLSDFPIDRYNADWFTPSVFTGLIEIDSEDSFNFLAGEVQNDEGTIVISDYMFDHLFPNRDYASVTTNDLVLDIFGDTYKITGIIGTNYIDYEVLSNRIIEPTFDGYNEHNDLYLEFNGVKNSYYSRIFATKNNVAKLLLTKEYEIQFFLDSEVYNLEISTVRNNEYSIESVSSELKQGEVFIDINAFNKLFLTNYAPSDIKNGIFLINEYDNIEMELEYQIINPQEFREKLIVKNFKVKGIYYDESIPVSEMPNLITMSNADYIDSILDVNNVDYVLYPYDSSIDNSIFFENIEGEMNHFHFYSEALYSFDYFIDRINIIINSLVAIFAIFSTLLIGYMVIGLISDDKKNIGILRSLGLRKVEVFFVYVIQVSSMIIPTIVIGFFFNFIIVIFLNDKVGPSIGMHIPMVTNNINSYAVMLGLAIAINVLSLIIPFSKYNKLRPIEIIYNRV